MLQIQDKGQRNEVIGDPAKFSGSIVFHASDSVVILPQKAAGGTLDISIHQDGGRLDLSGLRRVGRLRLVSKNGGCVAIGLSSTIENAYLLADTATIRLGQDCMVSFDVSMRTTDAHGIYDIATGNLLNPPGDVEVGDHCWIGQGALLSKNTVIETGCVIGARSFLGGKTYHRNRIFAGTPAREVRSGIVWERGMAKNLWEPDVPIERMMRENITAWTNAGTAMPAALEADMRPAPDGPAEESRLLAENRRLKILLAEAMLALRDQVD